MMANAQKMIEERKKALTVLKSDSGNSEPQPKPSYQPPPAPQPMMRPLFGLPQPPLIPRTNDPEKAKKIAQLQVCYLFT